MARSVGFQVLNGLTHMHGLQICHRDLKPENILTSTENGKLTVKIADLGTSKKLLQSTPRMNTPYVVSRYYRAPELILGNKYYDWSIDVWSFGCIFFELLTGTVLFPAQEEG